MWIFVIRVRGQVNREAAYREFYRTLCSSSSRYPVNLISRISLPPVERVRLETELPIKRGCGIPGLFHRSRRIIWKILEPGSFLVLNEKIPIQLKYRLHTMYITVLWGEFSVLGIEPNSIAHISQVFCRQIGFSTPKNHHWHKNIKHRKLT